MFVDDYEEGKENESVSEPSKNKTFTQRSSSSANSQEEVLESPKKKKSRRTNVTEVGTEDLPNSNFSLNFAKRKEAQEVENKTKINLKRRMMKKSTIKVSTMDLMKRTKTIVVKKTQW